jgi:hypothetical protein
LKENLHSVGTFVDEGQAFIDRHPDLNEEQATMGGVMWGLLRAIMECDNCPGHYRVPLDKDWDLPGGRLYCANCGGVWTRRK